MPKYSESFEQLLQIMDELRTQCPWDKKQTFDSLRQLTIEEVYELSEALLEKDLKGISEELGDLLLHIVFYARLGKEQGAFDIGSVIDALNKKLIHRHPHIYGDVKADTEEQVKANWEQIKLKEGKKSVLQGVAGGMPALVKAIRIQEKVRQVGFEWAFKEQVWDKVKEEIAELEVLTDGKELQQMDMDRVEDELGDVFFALVNYARFIGLNAEDALERTNRKFIYRFKYMEEKAAEAGVNLQELSLEEMDVWWEEAKNKPKTT